MNVFDNQRARSTVLRKLTLASIFAGAVFGVTAVGFATEGFTRWPWTVHVGQDGKVRDENGSVVGQSIQNADGSTTVTIQTSPTTGLMGELPPSVQGENIQVGAKPYAPAGK